MEPAGKMRPVPAENDKPSLVTGVFLKNVAWRLYKSISEFALFRVLHNALRLADFHRSSMPKIVVFLGNIGSHERCWQGPERISLALEKRVVAAYISSHHPDASISFPSLLIHSTKPYLVCSPDGVVQTLDSCPTLVEVKTGKTKPSLASYNDQVQHNRLVSGHSQGFVLFYPTGDLRDHKVHEDSIQAMWCVHRMSGRCLTRSKHRYSTIHI